jgi:hypothetical protein
MIFGELAVIWVILLIRTMRDRTAKVKLILLQLWLTKTEGFAASDAFFSRQEPTD